MKNNSQKAIPPGFGKASSVPLRRGRFALRQLSECKSGGCEVLCFQITNLELTYLPGYFKRPRLKLLQQVISVDAYQSQSL